MKRFPIILIVGAVTVYVIVMVLRGPGRDFAETILADDPPIDSSDITTRPSYVTDTDRDGLSDAKENIYGTNMRVFDTDDDGFSDGEEVRGGFDPTIPGESKIEDNEALMANLTVRYFLWAQSVTDVEDPQLSDIAIQQFLEQEGMLTPTVPKISDADVRVGESDSDEAIVAYTKALSEITLPEATASFVDLADEVIREQQSEILDEVITGLDETYAAMRSIETPPLLADLHRKQLGFLKALRNLFVDLYAIENDPVLLVRDIEWGAQLLNESLEVEKQRLEITGPALQRVSPAPEAPSE